MTAAAKKTSTKVSAKSATLKPAVKKSPAKEVVVETVSSNKTKNTKMPLKTLRLVT